MENLGAFVDSMIAQGLLDHRFKVLQHVAEHPFDRDFLHRHIHFFLYENRASIDYLQILAECGSYFLDYDAVFYRSCLVRDSCFWIGARRLREMAAQICDICLQHNTNTRRKCIQTINELRDEFCHLQCGLEEILELFQQIRNYEAQ